jgi:hypothetical protein
MIYLFLMFLVLGGVWLAGMPTEMDGRDAYGGDTAPGVICFLGLDIWSSPFLYTKTGWVGQEKPCKLGV